MAEFNTPRPRGFLDLPRELRDEIYEYIVVKPSNTITMLENHNCFQNEVSAAQPAISRTNKQIRAESLPMFYKRNLFLAELSNFFDLNIAKNWVAVIGDIHVAHLRWLSLCGWTKVAIQNQMCRLWIRVNFNVQDGTLEVTGNEAPVNASQSIRKDMQPLEEGFRAMMQARNGTPFDTSAMFKLMEGFHCLCADYCTANVKDHDGSCERCEPR